MRRRWPRKGPGRSRPCGQINAADTVCRVRADGGKRAIDRGTWLALVAMAIAVFVVANDFSAINVVILLIEEDFDISVDSHSGS